MGRQPASKTLRPKLDELSQQRKAVHLGTLLARHWLEVGLVDASYLDVDGHVRVYNGTRLVPEVWNSHRRMPLPGIVQYFVKDLRGRPLLVVTDEVLGNLAKSLPAVIASIRRVVGNQRFTVILDRGGFDGQLFKWLVEQGLDFITFQRGDVQLDDHVFMRREVRWDGQRGRFFITEDAVRVGDSGPWRRVVIRTPGHQLPTLTRLNANAIAAERVGALMPTRLRQENFSEYARAHLGFDALTTYAAETAEDREVPNPAVKATRAELKRLRRTIRKLRAALGRSVALDAVQPTAPADPTRPAALISELQQLEAQMKQIRDRLRSTPANVRLSTLGLLPQSPQLETKLIVDTVKVAAYNAQSWLADRLARHYPNTNDLHVLLPSFAHVSGTLIRQVNGGLTVHLQPPDIPLQRRALAGLCADLNLAEPLFPAPEVRVHYEVADAKAKRHATRE